MLTTKYNPLRRNIAEFLFTCELEKLDTELERLEKAGIIEKVETATDWVSPIVITPKKGTDEIRVCVDMGAPNRAIKRVRHVIPTTEDLRHDVNGAKVCCGNLASWSSTPSWDCIFAIDQLRQPAV